MRTYRVDQIVAATPGDCGFTAEPGFELASYWHTYLADFHRRRYTGHAVIRLSGEGVRRMPHLLSAAAVAAVETAGAADADGWVRARVPIESAGLALADFLRLGADIEILEPAELREQAVRTIQAMAAICDQPAGRGRSDSAEPRRGS
jgi:predicted DNA-binding transcriptional regulator YafY